MPGIFCSGCGELIFNASHAYRTHIYTMCSVCIGNGKAVNYCKSYHQLIEKSQFDSVVQQREKNLKDIECLKKKIKEFQDFHFKNYFENGAGLNNFLTQKLCEYMQSYNIFVKKITNKSPALKGLANRSIKTTLKQVQRSVMSIIALEAETLADNIAVENKDNEKRITRAEAYRQKIRSQMPDIRIQSSHGNLNPDNKNQNPEVQEFIFSKAELAAVIKIIENNIQQSKANGLVLSSLIKEGEKIASQLSREEKEAMNLNRTSTTAIGSKILSQSITEEPKTIEEA